MFFFSVCGLSSEDGGQFPSHRHDGDAGGWRWADSAASSQDSTQSPSQTHIQVPDSTLAGHQGDRRTPTVTFTCQTREGTHAHTCQVKNRIDRSLRAEQSDKSFKTQITLLFYSVWIAQTYFTLYYLTFFFSYHECTCMWSNLCYLIKFYLILSHFNLLHVLHQAHQVPHHHTQAGGRWGRRPAALETGRLRVHLQHSDQHHPGGPGAASHRGQRGEAGAAGGCFNTWCSTNARSNLRDLKNESVRSG